MIRSLACAFLLALFFSPSLSAEVLTIPGEHVGHGIPPGFQIKAKGLSYNKKFVYAWIESEGNCRWHHREICQTRPDGSVVCRTEREWKCQTASDFYKFPSNVRVDEDQKRAFVDLESGKTLAFAKVKRFLWNKWLNTFDGAKLRVTYESARLTLDTEKLADSLRQVQFQDLYQTEVD